MVVAALAVAVALVAGDLRPYTGATDVPVDPSAVPAIGPEPEPEPPAVDEPPEPPEPREWIVHEPGPGGGRDRAPSVAPEELAEVASEPKRVTSGPSLGAVGPPGQQAEVVPRSGLRSFDERPPSPEATDDEIARWQRRRRNLRATVGVFGGLAALGVVLILVPATQSRGCSADEVCDGEALYGVAALAAFGIGGAGTVVAAPVLAHHLRWDRPTELIRVASPYAARRAQRRVRQLKIAIGAEAGVILLGGVAIGASVAAAAVACSDLNDYACSEPRTNVGIGIGYPLIVAGSVAIVTTLIPLWLHRRHGHLRGSGPWLTRIGPTGATLRF